MRDHRRESVAQALAGRRDFLQLVLIGVLLALATNILATAVTSSVGWSTATTCGAALLAIVGIFTVRAALTARLISRSFSAVLVLSPNDLEPRETEVYEFSHEIARILKAAIYENKAFADAWRREPVTRQWDLDPQRATATRTERGAGLRLLHEALETWLLQTLSTHLTDYYHLLDDAERQTTKLEREHVPSILLENRVLNLLSTPVADRPAFLEDRGVSSPGDNQDASERVVYYQQGPGDALFERFELVLPIGTKVARHSSGALTIDTPRLHLSLRAKHDGFTGNLPFRLLSHFYRLDPMEAISLLISIELRGRVKPLGLLRRKGWHLYHWVDSFADKVEEEASVEALLARIQWPAVEAMLIAGERRPGVEQQGDGAGERRRG